MMRSSARQIELEPGSPVAKLVTRAGEAFDRGDEAAMNNAYREAADLANGDRELRTALATDHLERLVRLRRYPSALAHCERYLDTATLDRSSFVVQRAEIRAALGAYEGVREDLVEIRSTLATRPDALTADEQARVARVKGLAAAAAGDNDTARRELEAAEALFRDAGALAEDEDLGLDRQLLGLYRGETACVAETLSGPPPQTVAEHLGFALALKHEARYESAIAVLLQVAGDHVEPELRAHVLHQIVVLYRMTAQPTEADRYLQLLVDVVAAAPDQRSGALLLAWLSDDGLGYVPASLRFGRRIQRVRQLVGAGELDRAEAELVALRSRTDCDQEIALWHLVAGELELALGDRFRTDPPLQEAIKHLTAAARSSGSHIELRVHALRLLGRAHSRLGEDDRAAHCWAEAHRIEEEIVSRQQSDRVQVLMLQGVPDEHDERIRAAVSALGKRGAEGAAAIAVAIEAARGASILGRILPDQAGSFRNLPRPSDHQGAWQWIVGISENLARSQAIWMMHSTNDRVHHVIIGRGLLYHAPVQCRRTDLEDAIDALAYCWGDRDVLDLSMGSGQFETRLARVAELIGVAAVIPAIPRRVRRIATVAGGALAEIPLSAIRLPDGPDRIVHRFALSDLPCLSALLPLRQRNRQLCGSGRIRVSPPAEGLTDTPGLPASMRLRGHHASPALLRVELAERSYRQVRIDAHGRHDHLEPHLSWLQLAPDGTAGRLGPEQVGELNLSGCATVVLGACESGMARRLGRDERVGFVRTAIQAGSASVVAARWMAEDTVAGAVLDRFERYARRLPRDVALQRAQLDILRAARGTPTGLPAMRHPARWACWTLYGDAAREGGPMIIRMVQRGQELWSELAKRR